MPSAVMMHRKNLPLCSLNPRKLKSKPPALLLPEFIHTLFFDSTRLLSGLLTSVEGIEYAIATCGTRTVISSPARSINVAVIEWKDGWVDTGGLKISLHEWIGRSNWGSSRPHVFKKWGDNPVIRWEMRDGNWKATDLQKQALANFVARRGTLTSRIEITQAGKPYIDALVLTGLLSVTGREEWKWHNYIQAQKDFVEDHTDVALNQLLDEHLPTYGQAPFTRPVEHLLNFPPPQVTHVDEPNISNNRPLKLTLDSQHPLSGTWYENDRPVARVQTTGTQTTVSPFIHTPWEEEPLVEVAGTIEWAERKLTIFGTDTTLDEVLGGENRSSIFSETIRKSQVCTLPTLTSRWTTTPYFSSTSVYLDDNAHIRYESHTGTPPNCPLVVFDHYLNREGTSMELTLEGHDVLVEVLVSTLVLIYGPMGEWKQRSVMGE